MTRTKKTIAGFALFGALAVPGIALAATSSADSGTINDYNNNPGRIQSQDVVGAPGAGAGAFGFFGKGNNLAGGANGPATGAANSSLAGNRAYAQGTDTSPQPTPRVSHGSTP